MPAAADYGVLAGGTCVGVYAWRRIGSNVSFLKRLALVVCGAYGVYITWEALRKKLLWLLSKQKTDINIGFRERFEKKFVFLKEVSTSTDSGAPKDTSVRHTTEESIKRFIASCGLKPYSFSSSTTEAADSVDCHLVYSYQDWDIPYKCNAVDKDHVLYMMDVNYYFDLPHWLWMGRPIILYSFYPTKVGGESLEGLYSIRDNMIITIPKNRRQYFHQAFRFDEDYFVIKGALHSLVVTVNQFVSPFNPNRRVVCLTPVTWYPSAFNWLTDKVPNGLKNVTYQYGNANVLITPIKNEQNQLVPYVSIGFIGEPEEMLIKYVDLYKACYNHSTSFLYKFRPMVESLIENSWFIANNGETMCFDFPETGRIEESQPQDQVE